MSDGSEKQALKVYNPNDVSLAIRDMMSGEHRELSSFDPDSPEGIPLLIKATLVKLPNVKSKINTTVSVADWYIHPAQKSGKAEGEIDEFPRCVVFDEKGEAWDCGSGGVVKAIAQMARIRKTLHFDPPIRCKVEATNLSDSKQWITLIPNVEDLLANKTTPKSV